MHFQGQQLISQATHVSSRTLVTVSLAKIFAIWFDINTSDLEVLGLQLGEAFVTLAPYLIGFLALNHLLSWLGDLHAFQAWNSTTKIGAQTRMAPGGSPLRSHIENCLDQINLMKVEVEAISQAVSSKQIDPERLDQRITGAIRQLLQVSTQLQNLEKRIGLLSVHAQFYLWGWFLFMPMGLAACAVYLSLTAA